ncbi:CocE/NonD family hydrolase [Pseudomonas sp. H11T01]|uniref:CocE/NonD family hydrolase n=1 Tax=Pseudomonas sp. H11T01 TaxID=3402749 RepID=UPI003AC22CC2
MSRIDGAPLPLSSPYGVNRNVKVKMRDGVELATDIYRPAHAATEALPTILIRTPYDKMFPFQWHVNSPYEFTKRGYISVIQDVRGTFSSEGEFDPLINESWGDRQDGADTIAWIRRQPWSNGQVTTFGGSYIGGVQLTLLTMDVPGYQAAFVEMPAVNKGGVSWLYNDQMLDLQTSFWWSVYMAYTLAANQPELLARIAADEVEAGIKCSDTLMNPNCVWELLRGRSLRDALIVRHLPFWHRCLDARENSSLFDTTDALSRLDRVMKPIVHFSGWYDLFNQNSIDAYVGITASGATPEAREGQRLWIGPWGHQPSPTFRQFPESQLDDLAAAAAWMDQQLRGETHPAFDHPVIIYVMGENRWRAETAWPLPGTQPVTYYLHSEGAARSANGNGILTTVLPSAAQTSDTYLYDPADPVPTLGGRGVMGGPVNQRPNDERDDVLVYTTAPLEEDLEVTGSVRVTLHASSSATDTDWFVTLVDVFANGESYNLGAGSVRARYRKSRSEPVALKPGEVVAYEIDMMPTSNVFKKGHRIRLIVSSSNFPESDINPNQFIDLSEATPADYVVAEQAVHHNAVYPSAIELPVIPADRARNWIPMPFARQPGGPYYQQLVIDLPPPPIEWDAPAGA